MRNIIAIAASLALNLTVLVALQHSAEKSLPKGEVTVSEVGVEAVPALAQVATADSARAAL